jgi:hypothetical protein
MANCISYSIFGYNNQHKDSFDFRTYVRLLGLNLRIKELIFPDWQVVINTDPETYEHLKDVFFNDLQNADKIKISIREKKELCYMMLYRLTPIFENYDRVICRDTDSLFTYRERQAVEYWVNRGKNVHAITDSVSHTIPLMGGMVGFKSREFKEIMGCDSFESLISLKQRDYDFNIKGSDQDFLNEVILPKMASSMTEHYILGMPQSFRGDCHNFIQDVELDIDIELKESNHLVNHIGQSGCTIEPVLKFLNQYESKKNKVFFDFLERKQPETFYWKL